jgi:spermidine/putrescine-binding protein
VKSLNKLFLSLALLIPLVLASASPANGQTAATGQIVGTITDPSKAAVGQATVTATNEATGVARTVKTTTEGDYVVPLLVSGHLLCHR